ncbi:MAG TPA: DUF1570 domain-containing protein [Planctomycetota bacterium]
MLALLACLALQEPLPAPLLEEARARVRALPPGYRAELPPRAEALLAAGKGTREDVAFLRDDLLAVRLRDAESRVAQHRDKAREILDALPAAGIDTLHLKDGRVLTGRIEEETPEHIRLKARLGSMKFAKGDVARIERGAAQDFLKRYAAAAGKPAELAPLLDWCVQNKLPQGRECAANAILAEDPAHAGAWAALGLAPGGAPPAAPERDVVVLKDGTRRDGVIASESDAVIVMDVLLKGSKGETIGLGKATLQKADVARVERMPEASRAKARERLAAFTDRSKILAEALSRIQVSPFQVGPTPGFRADVPFVSLRTTGSESAARETAHALGQMFLAFQRHFSVRRNAGQRITVYVFQDRREYDDFQRREYGGAVLNPAFFDGRKNHIAAYNSVQTAQAAEIRARIEAVERQIEAYKKDVSEDETAVDRQVREIRARVDAAVAEARKEARGDPAAEAEITRQRKAIFETLKAQEREVLAKLQERRKRANEAIEANRAVVRKNLDVLAAQSREMYETLFHESFHAFAANFLWAESDNAALPRWLHEGLATYYERSAIEAGELVHGGVHAHMLEALRKAPLQPLEKVITAGAEVYQVSHASEADRSTALYAHAWGLAHFLVSRGTSREAFEAYVKDISAGANRRSAFEKMLGRELAGLDAEWARYIAQLK